MHEHEVWRQAMIPLDAHKILLSARQATTEDLLNRVTVFREGMESEAVEIIEMELHRRGMGAEQIEQARRDALGKVVLDRAGLPVRCSLCSRPAIVRRWGWHRLWGRVPVFPRLLNYCAEHLRP
jgi:hypothetical protein